MLLSDLDKNGWSVYDPVTTVSRKHGEIYLTFSNNKFTAVDLVLTINLGLMVRLALSYKENSYSWFMEDGLAFPTALEINEYATRLIKEV
jgi:hypothetical protein